MDLVLEQRRWELVKSCRIDHGVIPCHGAVAGMEVHAIARVTAIGTGSARRTLEPLRDGS